MKRWRSALAAGLGALGATGCAQWGSVDGAGYYWQSISGHVDLLQRARPVDDWLAAADTGEPLRRRLQAARGLRAYASE
ncbi:MAG TPA: aminopeptidase, partial [Burkholderiaceae bacterium]|nr:aminopeptidase [Burkholderiaceae bacterium]